jgi:hypothetical protein
LAGKSKKVSEFSDSALQVRQTIHEVRHDDYSMQGDAGKLIGVRGGK